MYLYGCVYEESAGESEETENGNVESAAMNLAAKSCQVLQNWLTNLNVDPQVSGMQWRGSRRTSKRRKPLVPFKWCKLAAV